MSSSLNPSAPEPASARTAAPDARGVAADKALRRASLWRSALREPLLHFVVLGAALFAVDHLLVGRADDPRSIVVGASVDAEARQTFMAARGREPSAQELAALRRVWLDNEVLYREGLAMQVDRGDTAIRERVIFKALSVVDAGVKLPPFDDAVLRAWFEKNRARYDEPPRYDFQEAVLTGDRSESAVRSFVAALNAGAPGDAQAGLRVFKGRPHANLVQSYGADFAPALEAAPPGEWRALPSREGLRVMRLDAVLPARPAAFEPLRGMVLQDWTDAVMAEQRSAVVQQLARKYKVTAEAAKP
jgi:hypothetical protein